MFRVQEVQERRAPDAVVTASGARVTASGAHRLAVGVFPLQRLAAGDSFFPADRIRTGRRVAGELAGRMHGGARVALELGCARFIPLIDNDLLDPAPSGRRGRSNSAGTS